MKQDLEKVKELARDLRDDKASPRGPHVKLSGYALAARALDKCRSALIGWQGDYLSNCPLDQRWLKFAGIDYQSFRSYVATGATDAQIAAWIGEHARKRPPAEIEAWNKQEGAVQLS